MPWCPDCRTEYEAGVTTCADCGSALVDEAPVDPADLIVVFEASSAEEAEIAAATLRAEGIPAETPPTSIVLPQDDAPVRDDSPELHVLVPAEYAEQARTILAEPRVSEDELTAAEEADTQSGDATGPDGP